MKKYELGELTIDELQLRLEDSQEELANLRFQQAVGQIENPLRIRTVRREIAQIKTALREYDLQIRKRPEETQVQE